MKWLVFVLAVVNIAYLALHLAAHPATGEGHEAHAPLHADRIALLPPGSVKPAPVPTPADNSADNSAANAE